jgi:hypothetical protein
LTLRSQQNGIHWENLEANTGDGTVFPLKTYHRVPPAVQLWNNRQAIGTRTFFLSSWAIIFKYFQVALIIVLKRKCGRPTASSFA